MGGLTILVGDGDLFTAIADSQTLVRIVILRLWWLTGTPIEVDWAFVCERLVTHFAVPAPPEVRIVEVLVHEKVLMDRGSLIKYVWSLDRDQ